MLYKSSLFPRSSRWVSYALTVPHAGHGLSTFVHPSRTAFCLFLHPDIPPYPYALLLVHMLCRPFASGSRRPVPAFACLPSVGSSSAPQAFRTHQRMLPFARLRGPCTSERTLEAYSQAPWPFATSQCIQTNLAAASVRAGVCAIGEAGSRAQWQHGHMRAWPSVKVAGNGCKAAVCGSCSLQSAEVEVLAVGAGDKRGVFHWLVSLAIGFW
jgi:hypothetical protein